MIFAFIPYHPGDLGVSYNESMKKLDDSDWACFIDHDAMFTTDKWYFQLKTIIAMPGLNLGVLTGVTNRMSNLEQVIFPKDSPEAVNHDMYFHRKVGMKRFHTYGTQVREMHGNLGGVMMTVNKAMWSKLGGFKSGFLGVDGDFANKVRRAGYRVLVADGIYVYHWYRAAPGPADLKPHGGYDPKLLLPPIS